jgi:tRNA (cytidine/uridine-2'-O-)-methyltransferase
MHIVLVEPEIPPNTGNVARLCAATKTKLHLIEPFGFNLDDKQLKRAGMDYWQHVDWRRWASWSAFQEELPRGARLWFVESNGPWLYTDVNYAPEDYLVFGRETAGLPRSLLEQNRERWLRIPMFNPESRSLNLSNCVALVLFEALRQQGFAGQTIDASKR